MTGITKIIYIFIGIVMTVPMSFVMAQLKTDLEVEQEIVLDKTGEYFSDVSNPNYTINTYETVCKGYYIIEVTDTEIIQTGYGDLANEFTKTELRTNSKISTTSPDIVIPIDPEPIPSGDTLGL